MKLDNYFDLTAEELGIDELTIVNVDSFNCVLKSIYTGEVFKGFVLAKSPKGNRFTLCDVDFQRSGIDDKYQPRLVFRRTKDDLENVLTLKGKDYVRISFEGGADNYRNFWEMINFLKKFKDTVDTGDFDNAYQVVSDKEFVEYVKTKTDSSDLNGLIVAMNQSELSSVELIRSASIIKLLEEYKEKVRSFIDDKVDEKIVQNWLDEDGHKHRSKRCLIFGLEFINHYREGGASGNRYDLLTRVGFENKERVLIELKSPNDEIFEEKESETINEPKKAYSMTDSLSRAIPQILEYCRTLEKKEADDPELQKIGEKEKIKIAKSIIVIGSQKDDPRRESCLRDLRKALSSNLEIWTYTDVLNKIDSTITNLKQEYNS